MSNLKLAFPTLICLAMLPSSSYAKLVVYYDVLATRADMPVMEDWISIRTINATGQAPEVTNREIDKGVKQAFDDGFKQVKVRKTIGDDEDFSKKPVTSEREIARGGSLPMAFLGVTADGSSDDEGSAKPEPPAAGAPKPEKWEMWLEEKKDGQWVEVPDRRYPFTDYDAFARTFADYDKQIQELNRPATRYRLRWKAVVSKPAKPIETPEVKPVDFGPMPKPKSDFKGGTFGQDLGYDGHQFITLNGDGTGTLKLSAQAGNKRAYDIKWSLTEEGWVDIEKVRITSWKYSDIEPDDPFLGKEASRARFEETDAWYFDRLAWKVEEAGLKGVWTVSNARGKPAEHGMYHFKRGE